MNHTGQGIFFTSRAFNKFSIIANGYIYKRDNNIHDWSFSTLHRGKGTIVNLEINVEAEHTMNEVFHAFEGEDFAFNKTEIMVRMSDFGETDFISRSQAKRLLFGLEKFSIVTLDFNMIDSVGQGFVDEVFRVFVNKHPETQFRYVNANSNIVYMIDRSQKQASLGIPLS